MGSWAPASEGRPSRTSNTSRTIMASPRLVSDSTVVPAMQAPRRHATREEQPQRPHEHDRPERALALPLARGGHDPQSQGGHPAAPLEPARELDVLHERNVRIAAQRVEDGAP